jgi:putative transcriptional regulator
MSEPLPPDVKESVAPDPPPVEIVKATITTNRIKAVLAEKGITQEELSRRVGVSYRHINRLVLGRSEPSLLLALRIARVLNEPLEKLFVTKIITRKAIQRAA